MPKSERKSELITKQSVRPATVANRSVIVALPMSRRNGVHGPRPRTHWPKSTILLHDAIILRVDMMNAARVGPEEALRGRDCCKGVGPHPRKRKRRHGGRAMGCSVHTGRSAPAKTGGRPHFAKNSHFGDAARSVGHGRSGAPPLAGQVTLVLSVATRGTQGGVPYLICGARVASIERKGKNQLVLRRL